VGEGGLQGGQGAVVGKDYPALHMESKDYPVMETRPVGMASVL